MTNRYIEIQNCFKCPFCQENPMPPTQFKIWMCAGYGKNAPTRPLDAPAVEIPEWCSLPKVQP